MLNDKLMDTDCCAVLIEERKTVIHAHMKAVLKKCLKVLSSRYRKNDKLRVTFYFQTKGWI